MKTILLSQGQVTIVDDGDYDQLSKVKWSAYKKKHTFYAVRGCGRLVRMHREILQAQPGAEVDHIDGNGLNNQRLNLRLATRAQNAQGFRHLNLGKTSKYRGVFWHTFADKWQATIHKSGVEVYLGRFDKEEEAAYAYDRAAKENFGEFAQLNFP